MTPTPLRELNLENLSKIQFELAMLVAKAIFAARLSFKEEEEMFEATMYIVDKDDHHSEGDISVLFHERMEHLKRHGLRMILKKIKARMYVIVSEAWAVERTSSEMMAAGGHISAGSAPDKRSVLLISGEAINGDAVIINMPIDDEAKPRKLGMPTSAAFFNKHDSNATISHQGRMVWLLGEED